MHYNIETHSGAITFEKKIWFGLENGKTATNLHGVPVLNDSGIFCFQRKKILDSSKIFSFRIRFNESALEGIS